MNGSEKNPMIPEEVLKGFIIAMNTWETETWLAYQKEKDNKTHISNTFFEKSMEPLRLIFKKYCTVRERPYGRGGGFSNPSDYDPENERIVDTTYASLRRVIIRTHKPDPALPSLLRVTEYVLLKKAGEWRIDNKKYVYDDGTKLQYYL